MIGGDARADGNGEEGDAAARDSAPCGVTGDRAPAGCPGGTVAGAQPTVISESLVPKSLGTSASASVSSTHSPSTKNL